MNPKIYPLRQWVTFVTLLFFSLTMMGQTPLFVAPGASGSGESESDPAGLQFALDKARVDGNPNILYLQTGTYSAGTATFIYTESGNDNEDIELSGGWDALYLTQTPLPGLTLLDGGNLNQVLRVSAAQTGLNYQFVIRYLTIQNGYSDTDQGGGLMLYAGDATASGQISFQAYDCMFMNNEAQNGKNGGAVYANLETGFWNCKFSGNEASSGGAMILQDRPNGNQTLLHKVVECDFDNNRNYGNQGSAIWTNTKLRIERSYFTGESSGMTSGNGSAVWGNSGSSLDVRQTIFSRIRINFWGSAIQSFDGNISIVNCLFDNNKAGLTSGFGTVAYYHNNSSANRNISIINSTFAENSSQGSTSYIGGAIHFRGNGMDIVNISNSIFWDNGMLPLYKESGGIANIQYSLVEGGISGGFGDAGNNLNTNPLFASVGDYHLDPLSPCINSGTTAISNLPSVDLESVVRVLGGGIDLGCYEYNTAPTEVLLSTASVDENVPLMAFVGLLSATDDAGDKHTFALVPGNGVNDKDNAKFSISSDSLYVSVSPDFETQQTYNIYVRAFDSGFLTYQNGFVIAVNDMNDPPILVATIPDQYATEGVAFNFTMAFSTFYDEDAGDYLTISATLDDGNPLPSWLVFDALMRNFSGTPDVPGLISIKVTATDLGGLTVDDVFDLDVQAATGISLPLSDVMNMYPNPCAELVYFESNFGITGELKIGITDLSGKVVYEERIMTERKSVNISGWPAGIYLAKAEMKGRLYCGKLIVK